MSRHLPLILLLVCAITAGARDYDMMKTLGENNELFSATTNSFVLKNRMFRWVSDKREAARYAAFRNPVRATFLGFPVCEAIVTFNGSRPEKFYLSIYNRGDAGPMEYEAFEKLTDSFNTALTELTGEKGEEQKGRLASNMFLNASFRVANGYLYTVKWSTSGRSKRDSRPEYLQLEIEKFNPQDDPRKQSLVRVDRSKVERSSNLIDNVRRKTDGTVWIANIPMVDQGAKGYCVAAVAERILKYYGVDDVTQHTIAQISGTTDAGTSSRMMLEALGKAGSKFGIRIRSRYSAEIESVEELEKLVSRYNTQARRARLKKIAVVQRGNYVYVGETMAQMDPRIFRKLRCDGESRGMNSFRREIRNRINSGLPLVWCVLLGLVNEKQKTLQPGGGHMRLIIGYNDKDDTIVYSDTWGAGHEFKTMPLEDAWVMTMRLISIHPRGTRDDR